MATEALFKKMAAVGLHEAQHGAQHKINGNFGSRTRTKKKPRKKKLLEQVILISPRFVKDNPVDCFGQTWRQTLTAWDSLVRQTMIPPDTPIADLDLTSAVDALNGAIAGKERTSLPPGSGYVQFSMFLDALEGRVKTDRQDGLIPSESGRVNASIAFDIYLRAQTVGPEALPTRSKMSEHRRAGRRWQELIRPSVFLLAIYSDVAEKFVYAFPHLSWLV
ncbi:phosphotransferase family protein [Fusarium langsethiae]|uniref:Phosphotransferase family protein n=1 Tax=Fusarium langsethiae TaxID=179993 RepID=A0A0M9ESK2_FUSLA|nr:phosphotransferase family protein [Fusarium langsethiae]